MDNTHTGKDTQHLLREREREISRYDTDIYRFIKNLHILCVRERQKRESKRASERVSLASGYGSVCLQQRRSAEKAD